MTYPTLRHGVGEGDQGGLLQIGDSASAAGLLLLQISNPASAGGPVLFPLLLRRLTHRTTSGP